MNSFSLEYCSNRAILLLQTSITFLLSSILSLLHRSVRSPTTGSSRSPRLIKDALHVLTYVEICHLHHHGGEGTATATSTADESTPPPTTCAVCLNELKAKDEVRELRNCRHVFHRECLDRWVDHDENGTCPLCRAPLLETSGPGSRMVPSAPPTGPSWAVDRLLYLFGDDLLSL